MSEVENLPAPTQSFEERLKDRIKNDMGELLTDTELSAIVRKGVDKILWERRFQKAANRYEDDTYKQPLIEDILSDLLEPRIVDAIKEYIKTHEDEVNELINRVVKEGASKALLRGIDMLLKSEMHMWGEQLTGRISNY